MRDEERLLAFSRALTDSVRSGLPLAETLRRLSLERSAESVSAGKTLHESLSAEKLFPPLFIALIRAGEESGKVDAFLDRFSAWLEVRIDFRRRLARAFAYPAFACALAAGLFALFSAKAAPLLLQPLVDAGVPLPKGAVIVTAVGQALLANLHYFFGALLLSFFLLRAFARSSTGKRLGALAGHWLPGFRYALEESRYYQIASTMELLLAAGLRPRQLMDILLQFFEDDPLNHRRFARAAVGLSQGRSFSETLAVCFPEEDRPRLVTGEKAGRLDEALGKLAKSHHERHMHRLKLTATAFQLGATIALAPVCFALVMWIIWPAFSLLSAAGAGLAGAARETFAAPAMPTKTSSSRFNETQAKGVLDYMRAHAPGEDGGPKKTPPPKLKPMGSFKKIEPTRVRSRLDP
jgi:type II secretory pathway component PulF